MLFVEKTGGGRRCIKSFQSEKCLRISQDIKICLRGCRSTDCGGEMQRSVVRKWGCCIPSGSHAAFVSNPNRLCSLITSTMNIAQGVEDKYRFEIFIS